MASDAEVLRGMLADAEGDADTWRIKALSAAISALEAREARATALATASRMTDEELEAHYRAPGSDNLLGWTWADKPHRILYAVVLEARAARASEAALSKRVEELERRIKTMKPRTEPYSEPLGIASLTDGGIDD